jgi:histone deacetylase complex regulatory component SIN3
MSKISDQKNRRKKTRKRQAVAVQRSAAMKKRRSPKLADYVFDLRRWNKELEGTTSEIIKKMKDVSDLLKRHERRGGHGAVVMPQSSGFELKLKEAVDEVRELFENLTEPYNNFLEAQKSFYSAMVKADNVLGQINSLISEWPGKRKRRAS